MIRTATAHWTHVITRPFSRAGRGMAWRLDPKPRLLRQPERFPALDNARFVLISLVVVGHLVEQLVDTGPLAATAYRWIYLFHMPAFVLISGALSKPGLSRRRLLGIATGLLLPYLVFQTLYPAWDAWLFQSDWTHDYLTPYWLLWYLPSLACWRLLLPLFARLKFALPLAVTIALAAGLAPWIGYPFSLSRTLVFFPLFLLGYRIGPQRLQRLGAMRGGKVAGAAMLAAAAVAMWFQRDLDPQWLYASVGYADLHAGSLQGAAIRLALLVASATCALAMITLTPRRARFAAFGRRSLTAYLVHGFLVRGLLAAGAFAWLATALSPPAQLAVCLAAGALIAATLSTRIADKLTTPLTRPARWMAALGRTLANGWPVSARRRMSGRCSRLP